MRRLSSLLWLATAFALLAPLSGCYTFLTWEAAIEANEPAPPAHLRAARVVGESLELLIEYRDHEEPYRVRYDLTGEPLASFEEEVGPRRPALAGEIVGPHSPGFDSEPLPLLEDSYLGGDPYTEGPLYPIQHDTLFWITVLGDDIAACLRRPNAQPVYVAVPWLEVPDSTRLAYVGAGFLTPFTFALDVVTFPGQVVRVWWFMKQMDELGGRD